MSYEDASICLTLKSVALIKLVEAGVIPEAEDGSVDTAGFERFWVKFEPNIEKWFANEVSRREKKRYYSANDSASKSYGSRQESIYNRIPSLAFFLHFFLPFILGFFGALALILR